ncbi:Uncharacterised protein [Enterobacter hormaechei]|nr:Uncharacterised protein [Enterobacter hormaechei]
MFTSFIKSLFSLMIFDLLLDWMYDIYLHESSEGFQVSKMRS